MWYSHKAHEFQEKWFLPTLIKKIESTSNHALQEFTVGAKISLKSFQIELGKQKSTANSDDLNSGHEIKSSINALLSHLSPIMAVLAIKEVVSKAKQNDNLLTDTHFVKCEWFNPKSEKFTEYFLPLSVVKIIADPDANILKKIETAIRKKRFLIVSGQAKTLLKPLRIVSRCGQYYLRGFDYIKNDLFEVLISSELKIIIKKAIYDSKAPQFDFAIHKLPIVDIEAEIRSAGKKKRFIRIEYLNRNEKLSTRTLSNYKLQIFKGLNKKDIYLTGYCHSKKAERTFYLARIQQVETLKLKF